MPALRTTLARLKRPLLSRTLDGVRTGVELAHALDDGAVLDALLEGVTYDPVGELPRKRWERRILHGPRGRVSLGKVLGKLPKKHRLLGELAILGLVARGAGQRAAALRAAITTLRLEQDTHAEGIDLALLVGLDALRELLVHAGGPIEGVGALGALPALQTLHVVPARTGGTLRDIAGLGAAPALEELVLRNTALQDLEGLAGAARLRDLHVEGPLRSVTALASLPLRQLALHSSTLTDIRPLRDVHELESAALELPAIATYAELAPRLLTLYAPPRAARIARCPRLTTLQVAMAGPSRLELEALPALEAIEAGDALGLLELAPLDDLPALARVEAGELALEHPERFVALRALQAHPTDLGPIAALPALEELDLFGAASLEPLAGMRLARFTCRLDALTSLRGHPHAPGPEHRVLRSPTLRTLDGLGNAPGTVHLDLQRCVELQTLDGIEGLRETLRVLDLRGCARLEDVGALAGFDLRAIAIAGCPLAPESFPTPLRWALTRAQRPDLKKLGARRARTAPL